MSHCDFSRLSSGVGALDLFGHTVTQKNILLEARHHCDDFCEPYPENALECRAAPASSRPTGARCRLPRESPSVSPLRPRDRAAGERPRRTHARASPWTTSSARTPRARTRAIFENTPAGTARGLAGHAATIAKLSKVAAPPFGAGSPTSVDAIDDAVADPALVALERDGGADVDESAVTGRAPELLTGAAGLLQILDEFKIKNGGVDDPYYAAMRSALEELEIEERSGSS